MDARPRCAFAGKPAPRMSAAPPLVVEKLTRKFGVRTVVDAVSFSIERGEIVGLVGLNGAGKTTIINMILGVLAPTSGAARIDGIDVATKREAALARANFSAVYAPLPGNLTVVQNLRIFGMFYDAPDLTRRIEEMIEMFDLARYRDVRCGLLSSGEQTRASLAKAMLNRPRLLLLDEPTASIDPSTAETIRAHIRDYVAREQGAVLWTSHNMYEVAEVCHRMMLISQGRIVIEGDPRTLPATHGKASLEDLFIDIARETPANEETPQ
jgi:ABC-2 type transport system ATP-binding protein